MKKKIRMEGKRDFIIIKCYQKTMGKRNRINESIEKSLEKKSLVNLFSVFFSKLFLIIVT